MSLNKQEQQEYAYKIMNEATSKLYKLDKLSSSDIWYILEQYAKNELRQILADNKLMENK